MKSALRTALLSLAMINLQHFVSAGILHHESCVCLCMVKTIIFFSIGRQHKNQVSVSHLIRLIFVLSSCTHPWKEVVQGFYNSSDIRVSFFLFMIIWAFSISSAASPYLTASYSSQRKRENTKSPKRGWPETSQGNNILQKIQNICGFEFRNRLVPIYSPRLQQWLLIDLCEE